MTSPLVSVVIPTWNRAESLPQALRSVYAQTYGHWEVVLVDDGSTDGTREVAESANRESGGRVRYAYQSNRGAGAARNRGIRESRGSLVAFLDSDDTFEPAKLARQVELFRLCPELGLVYSDFGFVQTGGEVHRSAFASRHRMARQVPAGRVGDGLYRCHGLFEHLLQAYFICTIVGMVRSEVLTRGVCFPESLSFGEEWLFYLRVARACPAGFVDEPLSVYRHRPGSLARTDRVRNVERFRALLLAIQREFRSISPACRRITRRHLGLLERQLGYSAYKSGRLGEASRRLLASLQHELRPEAAYHALQAGVRDGWRGMRETLQGGGRGCVEAS